MEKTLGLPHGLLVGVGPFKYIEQQRIVSIYKEGLAIGLPMQAIDEMFLEALEPFKRAEPVEAKAAIIRSGTRISAWSDLIIIFISEHRVQIQMPTGTETKNYAEMGFEDGRSGKPTKAWETLQELSGSNGSIEDVKSRHDRSELEKRIQKIRRILRSEFSMVDDPLPLVSDTYRSEFRILRSPSYYT